MGSTELREQIRRRLDAVTVGEPTDVTVGEPTDVVVTESVDEVTRPGWLDTDHHDTDHHDVGPRVRLALGRRGVIALAVVAVAAATVGGVAVWRDRPVTATVPPLAVVDAAEDVTAPAAPSGTPAPPPPAFEIVVSVVGLVHAGGLVRLPDGSRVADALAAAGGAKDGADLLGLNLAQKLADGDQVLVGVAPAPGAVPVAGSATVGAGGAVAAPGTGGPVNLNTATEQQLDELPGIGPVTATAIVSWRTENGNFTDVEQLGEVNGIGPARLDKLRDLVTVR